MVAIPFVPGQSVSQAIAVSQEKTQQQKQEEKTQQEQQKQPEKQETKVTQPLKVVTWSKGGFGHGTSRTVLLDGQPWATIQIPKAFEGREDEYVKSQIPAGYKTPSEVTPEQQQQSRILTEQIAEARHAGFQAHEQEQESLKGSFMGREAQERIYGKEPERVPVVGIKEAKAAEKTYAEQQKNISQSLSGTTPQEALAIQSMLKSPTATFASQEVAQRGFDIVRGRGFDIRPEEVRAQIRVEPTRVSEKPPTQEEFDFTGKTIGEGGVVLGKYSPHGMLIEPSPFTMPTDINPVTGKGYTEPSVSGEGIVNKRNQIILNAKESKAYEDALKETEGGFGSQASKEKYALISAMGKEKYDRASAIIDARRQDILAQTGAELPLSERFGLAYSSFETSGSGLTGALTELNPFRTSLEKEQARRDFNVALAVKSEEYKDLSIGEKLVKFGLESPLTAMIPVGAGFKAGTYALETGLKSGAARVLTRGIAPALATEQLSLGVGKYAVKGTAVQLGLGATFGIPIAADIVSSKSIEEAGGKAGTLAISLPGFGLGYKGAERVGTEIKSPNFVKFLKSEKASLGTSKQVLTAPKSPEVPSSMELLKQEADYIFPSKAIRSEKQTLIASASKEAIAKTDEISAIFSQQKVIRSSKQVLTAPASKEALPSVEELTAIFPKKLVRESKSVLTAKASSEAKLTSEEISRMFLPKAVRGSRQVLRAPASPEAIATSEEISSIFPKREVRMIDLSREEIPKLDLSVPAKIEREVFPYGRFSELKDRITTEGENLVEIPKARIPKPIVKPEVKTPEREVFPYGRSSKLTDMLSTEGESVVEIPKARIPAESKTAKEGSTYIQKVSGKENLPIKQKLESEKIVKEKPKVTVIEPESGSLKEIDLFESRQNAFFEEEKALFGTEIKNIDYKVPIREGQVKIVKQTDMGAEFQKRWREREQAHQIPSQSQITKQGQILLMEKPEQIMVRPKQVMEIKPKIANVRIVDLSQEQIPKLDLSVTEKMKSPLFVPLTSQVQKEKVIYVQKSRQVQEQKFVQDLIPSFVTTQIQKQPQVQKQEQILFQIQPQKQELFKPQVQPQIQPQVQIQPERQIQPTPEIVIPRPFKFPPLSYGEEPKKKRRKSKITYTEKLRESPIFEGAEKLFEDNPLGKPKKASTKPQVKRTSVKPTSMPKFDVGLEGFAKNIIGDRVKSKKKNISNKKPSWL